MKFGTMSTEQGQFETLWGNPFASGGLACACACFATVRRVFVCTIPAFALILIGCFASGCTRFPAIDPNGQSIFLPYPASTEIRVPQVHATPTTPGIFPVEAYTTPTTPPPCLDGTTSQSGICNLFQCKKIIQNHVDKHNPGRCGEIQLSPLRVVAPVNGEVLLMAGICGKDGFLVKKEPLEWMLSPDSVGQFIEVGDDAKGRLCSSLYNKPKVEKLDVDFARGRTSSREALITRGTPGTDDDLQLQEGQTWITVSSPSEGVSRVTVLAPESDLWDQRRQTAFIYWVDSQATLPGPVVARVGEPVQLVTRVTRSENIVPAQGWIVRYTILDTSIAGFVPDIQSGVLDAVVDQNGQAVATLAAMPNRRGTTPVHIEVIRPAQPSENLPALTLHQGDTTVTFSSPALEVTSNGPPAASVGDIVNYVGTMANPGDIDAENTVLTAIIPASAQVVEVDPLPTQQVNGQLRWVQGPLKAAQQLDVRIALRLTEAQDVAVRFLGEAVPNLRSESSVQTRVVAPSVALRFEPADAAQGEVGSDVYYNVEITNNGPQVLTDLVMEVETDPGLQPSTKSMSVPILQPGLATKTGVAFRVQQEGQRAAALRIRSSTGNAVLAESRTSILGVPPRPKVPQMEANVQVSPTMYVGEESATQVVFSVRNPGAVKLENITVDIEHDPVLEPKGFDQNNVGRFFARTGAPLRWTPPDLPPGTVAQLIVSFVAKAPTAQARINMVALSGNVTASNQAQVQALSRNNAVLPPAINQNQGLNNAGGINPPPAQPRTGELAIHIINRNNPIVINTEVSYGLEVESTQNLPDSDLRIQLNIPQGVRLISVVTSEGVRLQPIYNEQTASWDLPPVQYVRAPRDLLRYTFTIVATVPQQQLRLSARVWSANQPNPKVVTEPVTVIAQ